MAHYLRVARSEDGGAIGKPWRSGIVKSDGLLPTVPECARRGCGVGNTHMRWGHGPISGAGSLSRSWAPGGLLVKVNLMPAAMAAIPERHWPGRSKVMAQHRGFACFGDRLRSAGLCWKDSAVGTASDNKVGSGHRPCPENRRQAKLPVVVRQLVSP